jgi:DNA modification methylase
MPNLAQRSIGTKPIGNSYTERQTRIINFRVPASVEAQLVTLQDIEGGITSPDKAARQILLEALREREERRRLTGFDVANLSASELFKGEASRILSLLPARFCRTCVTSPPYWRQRDYQHRHQLGWERTPEQYVNRLVEILMEVHRVLRDDGTLWVNLDDTYWRKQLAGIPWRLALELQRRGWHWRAEIVWAKASTPESVKDRPTRAHEPVLLFSKRKRYHYNFESVLEPHDSAWALDCIRKAQEAGVTRRRDKIFSKEQRRASPGITRADFGAVMNPNGKNRRDVWSIAGAKNRGSHSAVMPQALAELCIQAGSRSGDIVLDPFCGTGTTGAAARMLGRKFVGIDLLQKYVDEARQRLSQIDRANAVSESRGSHP